MNYSKINARKEAQKKRNMERAEMFEKCKQLKNEGKSIYEIADILDIAPSSAAYFSK